MRINVNKQSLIFLFKIIVLCALVIIGTFPENDWTYSIGIDPPLSWVFNHLYENGLSLGKHIIFPHGPLAFFMYPLSENVLLSVIVTSLLKALLVFNLVWLLSESNNQIKWLASFMVAYLFSTILGFNYLILINLLLLYCNNYLYSKKAYKILAFLLTAFAFYVKAYVAIISGILFLSFTTYMYFQNKRIRTVLIDCLCLFILVMAFWLFMYGTFNGFIRYVWGMFNLAQDNSSAASYYPYNNWIVLGMFILSLFFIFLINRTKKSFFYAALIGISLFAAWKHGMAREDVYHVKGFFIYLISCLTIYLLFYRRNIYINLLLSITVVYLFTINLRNSVNYQSSKYELFRINNFAEFVTEFSELKNKNSNKSQQSVSGNKLPQGIIDSISTSTVDVYPWDYSIVSVNNLNWQPRVVLHSYASYTSWLDEQNAKHFNSNYAPDFLIIEKVNWENINGGDFSSIDSRYFFNDEPKTMLQLLKNYGYWHSNGRFILLKKRNNKLELSVDDFREQITTWGSWIEVPNSRNGLLRARLNFNKSFFQALKSFFYKDEQFWIYMKLKSGLIHKYRIVPKNAVDGIWINPYFFNSNLSFEVQEIMFKASNQDLLKDKLSVNWRYISYDTQGVVKGFFNLLNSPEDSIILSSINSFEQESAQHWGKLREERFAKNSFSGNKSHVLSPNSFSLTYSLPLDSLLFQNLRINTDCWIKAPNYKSSNNILIVISIENKEGNIIWKGLPIDRQLIDRKLWNNIFSFIEYKHNLPNCILKAYLLNTSDKEVLVDDFRIVIQNNELEHDEI